MLYYVKQNINLFLYFKQVDFFIKKPVLDNLITLSTVVNNRSVKKTNITKYKNIFLGCFYMKQFTDQILKVLTFKLKIIKELYY